MSRGIAVLDASPLILLARAGFLDLLDTLGRQVVVPTAVRDEVAAKGPDDIAARSLVKPDSPPVVEDPKIPSQIISWELGAGESSALSLVLEMPDAIAVVDDLEARRCARALSIPVVGTAGIVLAAKRRGVVPEARSILEKLMDHGMYLSDRILIQILARVDEA